MADQSLLLCVRPTSARSDHAALIETKQTQRKRGCELEWMFWSAAEKLEGWPPELFPVAVPERRKQVEPRRKQVSRPCQ